MRGRRRARYSSRSFSSVKPSGRAVLGEAAKAPESPGAEDLSVGIFCVRAAVSGGGPGVSAIELRFQQAGGPKATAPGFDRVALRIMIPPPRGHLPERSFGESPVTPRP